MRASTVVFASLLITLAGCRADDVVGPEPPPAPPRVEFATFASTDAACESRNGDLRCSWDWPALTAEIAEEAAVLAYVQAQGQADWVALPYAFNVDLDGDGTSDDVLQVIQSFRPGSVSVLYDFTRAAVNGPIPGRYRFVAVEGFAEGASGATGIDYDALAARYGLPTD